MEIKRCFIAINLGREAISEIKRLQKIIKKKNFFIGKFTELESLHLTLKFLGEIDENKIKEVRKRLREIRFNCFDASFGEIGVFSKKFPKNRRFFVSKNSKEEEFSDIKIIWIELKGEIFTLQREIDEKLDGLFDRENRFMSHITIARVKHVYDKKLFISYLKNLKCRKFDFEVDSFYLMESELKPEGPIYKEIEKYRLES